MSLSAPQKHWVTNPANAVLLKSGCRPAMLVETVKNLLAPAHATAANPAVPGSPATEAPNDLAFACRALTAVLSAAAK